MKVWEVFRVTVGPVTYVVSVIYEMTVFILGGVSVMVLK